jgi:hypothetical protein
MMGGDSGSRGADPTRRSLRYSFQVAWKLLRFLRYLL